MKQKHEKIKNMKMKNGKYEKYKENNQLNEEQKFTSKEIQEGRTRTLIKVKRNQKNEKKELQVVPVLKQESKKRGSGKKMKNDKNSENNQQNEKGACEQSAPYDFRDVNVQKIKY